MVRRRGSAFWLAVFCTVFLAAGCKASSSQGPKEQAPVMTEEITEDAAKSPETEPSGTGAALAGPTEAKAAGAEAPEVKAAKAPEAKEAGETQATEAGPGAGLPAANEEMDSQEKIEAFAERLQEAVADRNLEGFADLMAYPLTVNMADGESLVIADREELLKQNPDLIFGDDFMMAIANVDTATLVLSKDRVVMGADGPGLVFKETGADGFGVATIQE